MKGDIILHFCVAKQLTLNIPSKVTCLPNVGHYGLIYSQPLHILYRPVWVGVDMICWAKCLPIFNKYTKCYNCYPAVVTSITTAIQRSSSVLQLLSSGYHQCYNCYSAVVISVTTAIQRSSSVLQLLSSGRHQCYNCYPAVVISVTAAIQRSSSVLKLLSSGGHQCYNCYPAVIISATTAIQQSSIAVETFVQIWHMFCST